jgi:predicted MPP superfamily phosphohydrolase
MLRTWEKTLLTASELPALIFVALVLLVYALAIPALIASVRRKVGRTALPAPLATVYFRRTILSLAVIGLGCFAYGYFIEPYWPEVTHVQIRTGKLADKSQMIRIAHVSDLHSDPAPRLEQRLPGLIAEEKPDVILFSGDAANSDAGIPVFRECLSKLAGIAPTYVVLGNWDVGDPGPTKLFSGTGVHELNGTAATINIRGTTVWLAGIATDRFSDIPMLVKTAPPNAFSVFLHHYPDAIYEVAGKVDLYCAGHTHGGQVALPLYGALITLSRYGKRFESGLYQVGQTHLYVNRGVGMEGGVAPRVRFLARPEVTVYEIGGTY